MNQDVQFTLRINPEASEWLIGPFEKALRYNCDESDAVRRGFKSADEAGRLIDVGAHRGTVSIPFLKDGWKVTAVEPDPGNFSHLLKRINLLRSSFKDCFEHVQCAVSNEKSEPLKFYKSAESSGVSTLHPFLDSHEVAFTVDVDTLENIMVSRGLTRCDFLKTDIEGYDFFALKGYPWHIDKPQVVACEFEDSKSIPLGYKWSDVADYLSERGYEVLVSEWHPIERYGVEHSWMGIKQYPCVLESDQSWGNLIAYRDPAYLDRILHGVVENVSGYHKLGELRFGQPQATDFTPSNGHDVFLLPDERNFYREPFSGTFLPGGNIYSKFEFFAPAGRKIKLRIWRQGGSPLEHETIDYITKEGRNLVTLIHEVKNLQFGFLATIHNLSNAHLVLKDLYISAEYDDGRTVQSASNAHPCPAPRATGDNYDRNAAERAKWENYGLAAKLSFFLRMASNSANSVSERERAWTEFSRLSQEHRDLLDPSDWNAIYAGLSQSAEWRRADRARTIDLPLNDNLRRDKPDGVAIYDVPSGDDFAILATHKIAKRGRYRVSCEFMSIEDRISFEVTSGLSSKRHIQTFEPCSVANELLYEGPAVEGDELVVRVKSDGNSSKVFRVELEDMDELAIDAETSIQMISSTVGKNLSKTSVLQKQPGIEELTMQEVERLNELQGRFAGERIFVLGSGPSLNKTPLEKLENEHVFAVNRIGLLLERVSWQPMFYTAFDTRVVPDNAAEISELDIPYKFFSPRYRNLLGEAENHYFHSVSANYNGFGHSFTDNAAYCGFGGGGTISVIAIQLAYFLGFREIYLLGMDASYTVLPTVEQSGDYQLGGDVKMLLTSTADDDPNHFDPRYYGRGKKWHNPNVEEMKIGFGRSARYISSMGGKLRNATIGGALEEVERVDFESLF